MDDDTETAEPADETEVAPDAPEPEAEPEPEPVADQSVEVVGGQPEPTPVGHQVVQDNTTTPGLQRTMTADGVETSSTES